jgi:hypothetical protein
MEGRKDGRKEVGKVVAIVIGMAAVETEEGTHTHTHHDRNGGRHVGGWEDGRESLTGRWSEYV